MAAIDTYSRAATFQSGQQVVYRYGYAPASKFAISDPVGLGRAVTSAFWLLPLWAYKAWLADRIRGSMPPEDWSKKYLPVGPPLAAHNYKYLYWHGHNCAAAIGHTNWAYPGLACGPEYLSLSNYYINQSALDRWAVVKAQIANPAVGVNGGVLASIGVYSGNKGKKGILPSLAVNKPLGESADTTGYLFPGILYKPEFREARAAPSNVFPDAHLPLRWAATPLAVPFADRGRIGRWLSALGYREAHYELEKPAKSAPVLHTHVRAVPAPHVHETKLKIVAHPVVQAVMSVVTNLDEQLDLFIDAIPGGTQRLRKEFARGHFLTLENRIQFALDHFWEVDLAQLFLNITADTIEDYLIGKMGKLETEQMQYAFDQFGVQFAIRPSTLARHGVRQLEVLVK